MGNGRERGDASVTEGETRRKHTTTAFQQPTLMVGEDRGSQRRQPPA